MPARTSLTLNHTIPSVTTHFAHPLPVINYNCNTYKGRKRQTLPYNLATELNMKS